LFFFLVELDQPHDDGESRDSEGDHKSGKHIEYLFTYKYTTYIYSKKDQHFVLLRYDFKKPFKVLRERIVGIDETDHDNLVSLECF